MIDDRTKTLVEGLQEFMHFDKAYLEGVVCADEVDRGVVQVLREVGDGGILPSHLSSRLNMPNVDRWRVTRRIQRMNKRLSKELGQPLAEKRGHRWVMTCFARGILGLTQEELEGQDGSAGVVAATGRHPPIWGRERRKRDKPS